MYYENDNWSALEEAAWLTDAGKSLGQFSAEGLRMNSEYQNVLSISDKTAAVIGAGVYRRYQEPEYGAP